MSLCSSGATTPVQRAEIQDRPASVARRSETNQQQTAGTLDLTVIANWEIVKGGWFSILVSCSNAPVLALLPR
ncbi:hypothetical protein [Kamptonema formosum]|uniref:hypothetical protein n=1 Tax=Kamptonema formosum TaxID=331992 RepID=UPI000374B412|nr:hypothetical protein [Oscillatoria sp. PCC 10802]